MNAEQRRLRALLDRMSDHLSPAERRKIESAAKRDAKRTLDVIVKQMASSISEADLPRSRIGFRNDA